MLPHLALAIGAALRAGGGYASRTILVQRSGAGERTLEQALALASTADGSTALELEPGTHRISQPLRIPSRVSLHGHGRATVSGGMAITGWQPEPGKAWLHRAALPAALRGRPVNQLWVEGQRRGAARSPTMRFGNVTASGLQAAPGQLLTRYRNASDMRCVTYQHWTAAVRKVVAVDATTGMIKLDRAPAPMTGDASSGSRYFLENAPEYLSAGTGTFYADSDSILYAPLAAEASFTGKDVVAARPGLLELVSNNHTQDISIVDDKELEVRREILPLITWNQN